MKKKRSEYDYPNLEKEVNLKSRQDFIETDYVDGVFDKDGRKVIRELNHEEKKWLDSFYGETVVTSSKKFNPTPETQKLAKKKSKYKKKIAKRRKDLKEQGLGKKEIDNDSKIRYSKKKIQDTEDCLDFLRKEAGVLNYSSEKQRALYRENNTRNECIYTNLKSRGMLIDLTVENYDTFVATMWDMMSGPNYDSQDAFIEEIEKRLEGNFLPEDLENAYAQYLRDTSDRSDDD